MYSGDCAGLPLSAFYTAKLWEVFEKMKKSYEMDMCTGPLLKKLLIFAVPLILSGVLQLLFNAADIVVVGKFAGSHALAAVGSTGALINLFTNVFIGFSIGANVLVAQYFGAKDEQNIQDTVHTSMAIGIIGGTGSAKTSLVSLISRLYDVSKGSVRVGGKDVREYDMETLRNEVAVVLQKNTLFSGTIYENLRWGDKDATDEMCRRACELACADEFIEKMPDGYNTYIEQGGSNVSGGQKQRLCIARALLKNPKILILDDSTSAVDTATDAKIRAAFATEIPNTTKIIIAQRISSVEHADRIIVMNEGEINGIGTHEELLAGNDIYREVYESQNGAGANADFDEEASSNKEVNQHA